MANCSIILSRVVLFLGLVQAYEPAWSTKVLNFLSIYNGKINNQPQVAQNDGSVHDLVEVQSKPVDVPMLRPKPVVFTEEASNGKVNILQLGVISEGSDNVIYLQLYNFTEYYNHKPGTFNFDVLQTLKLEDLQGDPGCVASFKPINEQTYFGSWADCRHFVNGTHPSYTLLYSCDGVAAEAPVAVTETYSIVPYVYQLIERYPLVYTPKNYVNPCERNSTQNSTNC